VWPPRGSGAVTVVLPIERPLPATAGESTVAVRVPGHEGLRRLLAALGRPLTATSANRSGEPPVLGGAEAERLVAAASATGGPPAEDVVVIDGGTLPGGPPSTIVRFDDAGDEAGDDAGEGRAPRVEVLREGAVRSEEVVQRLGGI
jgi:tRNA A37 threonylcarbamoyladenosine synthetase subunit TsaC/SUA5/YrdC